MFGTAESLFIWAQIFGMFGFILSVLRLQLKNPRDIALSEVPTASMWSLQYYLLNAQAGLIINMLCIVRGALIYAVPERYLKYVIGIFLIAVSYLILSKYQHAYELYALTGVYIYAIACLFRDNRPIMARLIVLHSVPWLIYNMIIFSYFGVLSSSLGMLSGIIGMARHESWEIGKCYKSFLPNIARSLFITPRTYP